MTPETNLVAAFEKDNRADTGTVVQTKPLDIEQMTCHKNLRLSECIVFCAGDQVILPFLFQLAVEAAKAGHLNHQGAIIFRMLLCVEQHFAADHIELHLESALLKIDRDGLGDLFDLLRAVQRRRMETDV